MRHLFLVDNSVIQRMATPQVRAAWDRLRERGDIATCLPSLLQAGYSARSASEHQRLMELERSARIVLPPRDTVLEIASGIQAALFASGAGRSVGVSGHQVAATALHHSGPNLSVSVVHYDPAPRNLEPGAQRRG